MIHDPIVLWIVANLLLPVIVIGIASVRGNT